MMVIKLLLILGFTDLTIWIIEVQNINCNTSLLLHLFLTFKYELKT